MTVNIVVVTIFHETIMAKVIFLKSSDSDYEIVKNLAEGTSLAMLEFSKSVLFIPGTNVLASKLDLDLSLKACKFIFSGTIIPEPNNFAIIKWKNKTAEIDRIQDENTLIGKNLVGHPSGLLAFIGKPVHVKRKDADTALSTGVIQNSFGTSGKFKIILDRNSPEALSMRPSELEVHLAFKNRVKL